MTGPDRDQLIEILAGLDLGPILAFDTSGFESPNQNYRFGYRRQEAAAVLVDALAPVLAARDKRKLREGRNQAAEAVEDAPERQSLTMRDAWDAGAMYAYEEAARLARGGSTDEERNDEQ